MNTIVLIIVSLVILAFLLIVGVLYLIQSKRDKDIKKQLEKLEIEKIMISEYDNLEGLICQNSKKMS